MGRDSRRRLAALGLCYAASIRNFRKVQPHMREDESEDFDASYNIVDNRNYRLTFSAALFILPSKFIAAKSVLFKTRSSQEDFP
jgi:hypothetical protein